MIKKFGLLTDLYQITMAQGYFDANIHKKMACFDMFYRENPSENGYAVFAGLEQLIEYIENLKFYDDDIEYLRGQKMFSEGFLNELSNFKFDGDIFSVQEGEIIFPNEPIIKIKSSLFSAQIIETALLNIINHQSLIATKAARIAYAAGDDSVIEFGLRRAQGQSAGILGARAAFIVGVAATSNVLAGKLFSIPIKGTHAHSWIMSFDSEIEAFRAYAKSFPNSTILLVDTYNTLKSGVPNAIAVFKELKEQGQELKNYGIRLDSGDMAYLSKKAREMLDDSGFFDAKIVASNDLDENIIQSLKLQGAKIDVWGVGTSLITSIDSPAFGGVYKMVEIENENGELVPKIKLSDNPEKITTPGSKKIYRIYDKKSGKIKADLITLENETIDCASKLVLFDPNAPWRRMTLPKNSFTIRNLHQHIYKNGKKIYTSPKIQEMQDFCKNELKNLWEEHKRLINPHIMPVDLSQTLYDLKQSLITQPQVD